MVSITRTAAIAALSALTLTACATPAAKQPASVVTQLNPCADLTVSIYFERDSVKLTREARAVLRGATQQAAGCRFGSVDVYGLADPVGTPQVNQAISDARAKVVTAELSRLGFSEINFRMVAAGEEGSVTSTGEVRPLRRRADVIFHVAQPS